MAKRARRAKVVKESGASKVCKGILKTLLGIFKFGACIAVFAVLSGFLCDGLNTLRGLESESNSGFEHSFVETIEVENIEVETIE